MFCFCCDHNITGRKEKLSHEIFEKKSSCKLGCIFGQIKAALDCYINFFFLENETVNSC